MGAPILQVPSLEPPGPRKPNIYNFGTWHTPQQLYCGFISERICDIKDDNILKIPRQEPPMSQSPPQWKRGPHSKISWDVQHQYT